MAGRKRKTGSREPNGRISRKKVDKQARRSIEQADMMSVVREARERVLGVGRADSGTELAGTAIGRMFLRGAISRRHLDAAVSFADRYAVYARSIDSPAPPRAANIGAITGRSYHDVTPEEARSARQRWDEIRSAIQRANDELREQTLYAAAWYAVIEDREFPHLNGSLRSALNAVANAIGLPMDIFREAA